MKSDIIQAASTLFPSQQAHNWKVLSEHPDGVVVGLTNDNGTPYLAVAMQRTNSIGALEDVLRAAVASKPTISVGHIVAPNRTVVKSLRKSFRTGDFDHISYAYASPGLLSGAQSLKLADLRPLNEKLENVLFEVHSALRDIDGLHAPEALDEICKLLYAKLFDEENTKGNARFQRNRYSSTEECAAEVRQLYLQAIEEDRAIFTNKIPTYERSRGVFREELLSSSPAIVRAVELLQHYSLSSSPVDIKGRAFQNVLLPAVRSGMGQYFTPKEVIEFVVGFMKPRVRDLVIDPFCGSGHFLTAAIDHVRREHKKQDKLFHEFAFTRLHGIEKSDRMVRIAMTDMRLHGDGHSNIRCTDALLPFANYPDLAQDTFDVVMTNPPFGVDLTAESLAQLGPFSLGANKQSSVSLEIVALERCVQLLRPGGRLAIVLPDGILSNRNMAYVRDWLRHHCKLRAVFSLPVQTFSPFGANIKTSVVVARKLTAEERFHPNYGYNIFLAEVEALGYDASGRATSESDLHAVGTAFNSFLDKEGW